MRVLKHLCESGEHLTGEEDFFMNNHTTRKNESCYVVVIDNDLTNAWKKVLGKHLTVHTPKNPSTGFIFNNV